MKELTQNFLEDTGERVALDPEVLENMELKVR